MEGFKRALQEYESKMMNPYDNIDEDECAADDWNVEAQLEEMRLWED